MSNERTADPVWSDVGPDGLIPESDVPKRAEDLEEQAVEWLVANRQYLDPFEWTGRDEKYWRKKAFLEVGGYLLTSRGYGGESVPELHDLIVDRANDRRYAHQLLRSPRKIHHFAAPILYAKSVDALGAETAAAFERAFDLGAFRECEWPAYRWVEFWYLSRIVSQLFGTERETHDIDTILEFSQLNHQPHVVRSTLPHAYCLTHDVMFYNNVYGIYDEIFPDDPAPYDISDILPGLVLRYMAEANCDIVLELVTSGVLQRQISRELVQFVLSWIMEKVDERGYVPGPDLTKALVMDSLTSVDQDIDTEGSRWDYATERERIWGENYHTTLVAGYTARIIAAEWDNLDRRAGSNSLIDRSFARDATRLGQVVQSLASYDLQTGARQLRELADLPVMDEYETVAGQTVDFLEDQRTGEGDFGYWTQERILFTNAGNSEESFQSDLVDPISEACRDALEEVGANDTE